MRKTNCEIMNIRPVGRILVVILVLALTVGLIVLSYGISSADENPLSVLSGGVIKSFGKYDDKVDVTKGTSEKDAIATLNEQIPSIPAEVVIGTSGHKADFDADADSDADSDKDTNSEADAKVKSGTQPAAKDAVVVPASEPKAEIVKGLVPVTWITSADVDADSNSDSDTNAGADADSDSKAAPADYDGDKEGEYEFTAVLPEGFDASDISLPTATVIVKEDSNAESKEEATGSDADADTETDAVTDEDALIFGAEFKVGDETTPVSVEIPAEEAKELHEVVSVAEACERANLEEDIPELLTKKYVGWVETDKEGAVLGADADDELQDNDVPKVAEPQDKDEQPASSEDDAPATEADSEDDEFTIDGTTPVSEGMVLTTDEVKALPLEQGTVRYFSAVMPLAIPSASDYVIIGGNNNEPLKAYIYKDGRQDVRLYGVPDPGYVYNNRQFFTHTDSGTTPDDMTSPSVGWILHVYENNTKWSVGKGDGTNTDEGYLGMLSQNASAITYNGVTKSTDNRTATVKMTVNYKNDRKMPIEIELIYHIDQGSRQMPVTVKITNKTGKNFSKMNFIVAEDSYFGGSLYSKGNYNALANMVYVWKNSNYGIMSIVGSAATPFNNWDVEIYENIARSNGARLTGDGLTNKVYKGTNDDTVLEAGWRNYNFNNGDTIEINYYESWTAPSALQVLAPAGKTVPPEARVNYEFNIINLTNGDVTTSNLTIASDHNWPVRLTSGSQNITIPSGETKTVTVELIVPEDGVLGVANGIKDDLTLTVTANGQQAHGTTTTTINEDIPALNIVKVGQTATTVTFRVDFLNYDYPHDTTVSILDMNGNVLGENLNVKAQTTPNFVSGGYFTFDITKLTKNAQYMAEANAQPEIPYPARTTFKIEPVYTLTFDKNANNASDPDPATKSVIKGDAYGDLATTTRPGFKFDGWYTAASGGDEVTKDTIVNLAADHTLYAHWSLDFTFTKVMGSDDTRPLPDAEFKLFRCNSTPPLSGSHTHSDYNPALEGTSGYCWEAVSGSVVSDSNGEVDFGGIASGTYLLRETEAPSGYERPLGWWIIVVDSNDASPIKSITGAGPSLPPAFAGTFGNDLRLPNYEKAVFPLTGSIPTDLTVAAMLVLGIAALIFVVSRKKNPATTDVTAGGSPGRRAALNPKNILRYALIDLLVATIIFTTLFAVTTGVYAVDAKTGSITVHRYEATSASSDVSKLPTEGKPLAGIPFKLQKVTVDPTPATTGDVVINYGGKAYVLDNSGVYSAQTISTNGAGAALFSGLPLGIYLVSEQSTTGAADPLIVGIPTVVSGTNGPALYDIDVYPKALINPPAEEPNEPNNPSEPQDPKDPGKKPVKPTPPSIPDGNENPPAETPVVPADNVTPYTPNYTQPGVQIPNNGNGTNVAQPEAPVHEVGNSDVPFGGFSMTSAWSLLSLIMSIIAIVFVMLLIICGIVRRSREDDDEYEYEDNDEKERTNAFITRTFTIIFGLLTPIVFLILDDMRLPMVWINKWTPYVAVAFALHIAFLIYYKLRNNKEEDDEDDDSYVTEQSL